MSSLRILFASAEIGPYSQVGGLGDVAAGLPKVLAALGHDIRVVTPAHASVDLCPDVRPLGIPPFRVDLCGRSEEVKLLFASTAHGLPIYFLQNSTYFGRPEVYGAGDDLLRYLFFSKAALELPKVLGWVPQILHLNEWHTAPMAVAVHNRGRYDPLYGSMASVYTIHNLAYRGPDELVDQVCQALEYADLITTVSPTYAREIRTPRYGDGLYRVLKRRRSDLFGILNGLDRDVFNPLTDPHVPYPFDLHRLEERPKNKRALLERFGLPWEEATPVIGMVTRIVEQKGFDLLLRGLEPLLREISAQLVVVGPGDESYSAWLREAARLNAGRLGVHTSFDVPLARQVYAGSDIFLMPSRFEPCGVGQLIAMWYGSVPVVRRTGGLVDTVIDADRRAEVGTGFVFHEYSPAAMIEAVRRAVRCYRSPQRWREIQERGMRADFSWEASAGEYERLYRLALERRGLPTGRDLSVDTPAGRIRGALPVELDRLAA